MKTLLLVLTILLALSALVVGEKAHAGDRVLEVQSRVNTALSAVLKRSDYLIVVNPVDVLEGGLESETANGAIKKLPGLRVGVDDKGQVVFGQASGSSYNGPVSVTVVIDNEVKEETVKTIEALLPEIMGGAQNSDDIKVRRALLYQPIREDAKPAGPQITIQNLPPKDPIRIELPKQEMANGDWMKFVSLLILGLGALMWLSGRNKSEPQSQRPMPTMAPTHPHPGREDANDSGSGNDWDPRTLEDADPSVSTLYIVKMMHEKKLGKAYSLFSMSSPRAQRAVLTCMPAWLSAYTLDQFESMKTSHEKQAAADPGTILRELTVLDKALTGSEAYYATNFIQWLPDKALSYVSAKSAMAVSTNMCVVLAFTRPDLASQFPFDESALLSNAKDLKPENMIEAYKEMQGWSSRMVDSRRKAPSIVDTMVRVINGLNTFEEIDAKFASIQDKLKPADMANLRKRAVSLESLKGISDEQKKEFLRSVDPNDYVFLSTFPGVEVSQWPIDKLMRPIRYQAFKFAAKEKVHEAWSAKDKSKASTRLLMQLRKIILGETDEEAKAA